MSANHIRIFFVCALICILFVKAHSAQTRILGGRDPHHDEVKYLVAIQSLTALCGGGIIHDKFIVTAAHCVKIDQKTGTLAKPTQIFAVLNNTRNYGEETIVINVARALLPKSIKLPFYGDVAILELEKSLDLENHKDTLQKLELPQPLSHAESVTYPSYSDETVKFAGFGHSHLEERKDANGKSVFVTSTSGPLQVAEAKIVDTNTCRKKYYGNFITDTQMCVRITEDEKLVHHQGVCTGDSGSPLVLDGKVIVGLASFNTNVVCNTNTRPAIFTRISSHIQFIENAVIGNTTNMFIIPK